MDAFTRAASENAARALMQAGNYRGAETRLRAMLAEDPGDARAMALLAHCLDEDPKAKGPKERGRETLKLAREAASLDPDDHLVRSTLSWALIRYGKKKQDKKDAEQITEDIASENPEDSTALFNLAMAWSRSIKDQGVRNISVKLMLDDAEKHASTAGELINMAYLRLREWNYEIAASLAQRAMQLDPTQPDVFRILGECELALKRPVEAYELALEALRLQPGSKPIMRLLTRARTRSNNALRPFIPGIDWIVEMDRRGLVVVLVLMIVLGLMAWVSIAYDLRQWSIGMPPVIVLSVGLCGLIGYALVSYLTAIAARFRIRRDLRRIALPNF
jgi:Flp pilus assembly protein TadD